MNRGHADCDGEAQIKQVKVSGTDEIDLVITCSKCPLSWRTRKI